MDESLQPQEGMNPEPVEVEETTTEETVETPAEEVHEETVSKSQFNQVLARAKKAEEALKKSVQPAKQITQPNTLSEEQVEIKILKAQGKSDEQINYLKKIAAVNNSSLLDAQSDDLYASWESKREVESKKEKARLGASRGSSTAKKEISFNTPNLTEEQHKELWKSQQG